MTHFPTFRKAFSFARQLFKAIPSLSLGWFARDSAGQQQTLLHLLAVSSEKSVPLVPLLESWAEEERGYGQRRIQKLIARLRADADLPDALEEIAGLLPESAVLAVRFGAQSGTLATTVRQYLEQWRKAATRRVTSMRRLWFHLLAIVLIGLLFVSFMEITIVPRIDLLLRDYGLTAPLYLQWVRHGSSLLATYGWVVLLLFLVLGWSFTYLLPRDWLRRAHFVRIFARGLKHDAAETLQLMAVAASAGRPLAGSLSTLARYHYNPVMRQKLLFVRNELEQGAEAWQSMVSAGLLNSAEAGALAAADRLSLRPWTLQQLALGKQERCERMMKGWSNLALPAVVGLLGFFVLCQAIAVIIPLSFIIHSLA